MLAGALPRLRMGAHVDVYKNDENGRPTKHLVQTSRRCPECGEPLTGAVVPLEGHDAKQIHVSCLRGGRSA